MRASGPIAPQVGESLAKPNITQIVILLRVTRRGVRFANFRNTPGAFLLDAIRGCNVSFIFVNKKAADGAAEDKFFMKPPAKLSKAELERAVHRLRGSNPGAYFGFQLVKAERGRAVIRMPVLDIHKQSLRIVHGGVVASLADTAGGFAAFLSAPEITHSLTIEMKINFLEPVESGVLTADARVLRHGRTVTVVDCNVTDADGRLVSKALMTFATVREKK